MPLIILFSLLMITVFWLDSLPVYRILYTVINLLILIIFFVSLEIQTSYFPAVPWYQEHEATPTVVTYLAVWLGAFGIIQSVLSQRIEISRPLKYLPFAGAAILAFTVILPDGLSPAAEIVGSTVTVFLMALQIVMFALNFKNVFK